MSTSPDREVIGVPSTNKAAVLDEGAASAGIARSAIILSLGNIASRVLGLLRETIISGYFGSSGQLSAFNVVARVPTAVFDLLVGGMLSSALVPVFSDYIRAQRHEELARVASAMLSLIALIMGVIVLLIELFAEPLASALSDFTDPVLQDLVVRSLRLIAPAIFLLGLSGGVTALLYALKRFSLTAVSGAVFNLGIIIAAPLLAPRIHVMALPLGIVLGSLMQLAVMVPALRDLRLHLTAAWNHPGVRRILRLYVPVAVGLIVTNVQTIVDQRWASGTGAQSPAWMRYASTLIQMPLGLVPVAVSLAALPGLSRKATDGDWEGFRALFARGLRLVLVLLIPAAVGMWVLAEPLILLLFQHGNFVATDTQITATALRLYLLGLVFAGVDFMLNYTFYARMDTRTPAIVGIVAVGCYFVSAVLLLPRLHFLGLVLADSVKQAAHASIMFVLFWQGTGGLRGYFVERVVAKVGAAALIMGLAVALLSGWMGRWLADGVIPTLALVVVAAASGGMIYWLLLRLFGVSEAMDLLNRLWAQFPPRKRIS